MKRSSLLIVVTLTAGVVSADDFDFADALVQAAMAGPNPTGSLSYGIVRGNELVHEHAVGYADIDNRIEATPSHVYRIGSITKQFTGLALVKLAHEGVVALTDPVERHFPHVNLVMERFDDAPPITLLQLATMTSGLAREPEDLPTYLLGAADGWVDVVIRALPQVRYDYPPDTRYQYSNIGYAVLGAAIENAADRDFMDYVREEMIEPMGLVDTDFVPRARFEDRIATGYVVDEDGRVDPTQPAWEHLGRGYKVPNGALYSTVADLARFISFQLGHGPASVIPHDVLDDNFSRTNSSNAELSSGYGAGFSVRREGELILHGHTGSVAGYRAVAFFDRSRDKGVVMLRNVTGADHVDLSKLAVQIFVHALSEN